MIDEQLLQGAIIIRRTFLRLTNELSHYQKDVKDLISFLQEKSKKILEIKENGLNRIKTHEEISVVTKKILDEIEQIETEEKRLHSKINRINIEMEKISEDEGVLYNTIKERYPELTDDDIIKEIRQKIAN